MTSSPYTGSVGERRIIVVDGTPPIGTTTNAASESAQRGAAIVVVNGYGRKSNDMQSSRPSRYHAIADYLSRRSENALVLTYVEIEGLIQGPLPLSAHMVPTWWTNRSQMHVRMWRELGWRAHRDREHRTVRFTRDEE